MNKLILKPFWIVAAIAVCLGTGVITKGYGEEQANSINSEVNQLTLLEPDKTQHEKVSYPSPDEKLWLHLNKITGSYLRLDTKGRPEVVIERNDKAESVWHPLLVLKPYSEEVKKRKVEMNPVTGSLNFWIQSKKPGLESGLTSITITPVVWADGVAGFWLVKEEVDADQELPFNNYQAYSIIDGTVKGPQWEDESDEIVGWEKVLENLVGINKKDGTNAIVFRLFNDEGPGKILHVLKFDPSKKSFSLIPSEKEIDKGGTEIDLDLPIGKTNK